MNDIPETKSDFRRSLRDLLDEHRDQTDNPGSYEVDGSVRCVDCMFTTDSEDCYKCTHCDGCTQCKTCTQCTDCEGCVECNHCFECTGCASSSHLVMSEDCVDSVYCFGCVGLVDAEFCILNEQFSREEYFERAEKLQKAFNI
ncbi:MAG: caib/baif family protein [Bradymonadaceae bacterium]